MPREVTRVPGGGKLTGKAPARMAGKGRAPKIRKAASAMPVQGQTAVALALTKANFKPSFPATKYTAAVTTKVASSFRNRERTIGFPDLQGGSLALRQDRGRFLA